MTDWLKRFVADERGATAIEYSLLAVGIAVAIVVVVASLSSTVNDTYVSVDNALQ